MRRHADTKSERLLAMVLQIQQADQGVSERDLLHTYAITARTLARDLLALERLGAFSREKDGRETIVHAPPSDVFTKSADLADFLALEIVLAQESPALHMPAIRATLEGLKQRVEKGVGKKQRGRAVRISRAFYSPQKFQYKEPPAPFVTELIEAISDKRVCEIVHHPQGRHDPRPKTILPLRLFPYDGALYLHAAAHPDGKVGIYNLRRVKALEVLKERGEPPATYDPKAWHERTFGVAVPETEPVEIVLRFEPLAAPMIHGRIWHPTQQLRDLPDGSVELRFTCGLSYEVDTFVTRWGKGVVVVGPPELRDRLADYGDWLARTYPRTPR
jgi:predicted DNA-binding transcriptional regulator YafY